MRLVFFAVVAQARSTDGERFAATGARAKLDPRITSWGVARSVALVASDHWESLVSSAMASASVRPSSHSAWQSSQTATALGSPGMRG